MSLKIHVPELVQPVNLTFWVFFFVKLLVSILAFNQHFWEFNLGKLTDSPDRLGEHFYLEAVAHVKHAACEGSREKV